MCFVFLLLVFLLIVLQFDCALADGIHYEKLWGDEYSTGVGTIAPSSAYPRGIVLNLAAASYVFDLPINRDYTSLEIGVYGFSWDDPFEAKVNMFNFDTDDPAELIGYTDYYTAPYNSFYTRNPTPYIYPDYYLVYVSIDTIPIWPDPLFSYSLSYVDLTATYKTAPEQPPEPAEPPEKSKLSLTYYFA